MPALLKLIYDDTLEDARIVALSASEFQRREDVERK